MVRVLLFIIFVTVAGMLAVWIAEQPGDVTLTWHDYLLESSVSMLIAVVLVCGVLLAFVFELLILIVRSPRLVTRFQRERMRERGYRFLTRGMVAVAAGDGKAAKRRRTSVPDNHNHNRVHADVGLVPLDAGNLVSYGGNPWKLEKPHLR